jgi:hypothetical protein
MTISGGNGGFNGFDKFLVDSPCTRLVPSRSLRISSIPPRIKYNSESNLFALAPLERKTVLLAMVLQSWAFWSRFVMVMDVENREVGSGGARRLNLNIPLPTADGVMNSSTRVLKATPYLARTATRFKFHEGICSCRLGGFEGWFYLFIGSVACLRVAEQNKNTRALVKSTVSRSHLGNPGKSPGLRFFTLTNPYRIPSMRSPYQTQETKWNCIWILDCTCVSSEGVVPLTQAYPSTSSLFHGLAWLIARPRYQHWVGISVLIPNGLLPAFLSIRTPSLRRWHYDPSNAECEPYGLPLPHTDTNTRYGGEVAP